MRTRAQKPKERQDLGMMRRLFGTVAPRYDVITNVLSYGMDSGWKRDALRAIQIPQAALILDLACGTADFSKLVTTRDPSARPIPCDLTEEMLIQARAAGFPTATCADAGNLPFGSEIFDAAFVGYGFRNFSDLDVSLAEMHRVLKPGATLVTLDFFLPTFTPWRALYLAYLKAAGDFWGWWFHREPRVYGYIADSLRSFVSVPEFSRHLINAGFQVDTARSYLAGGIAVVIARRLDVSLRAEAA